MCRVVLLGGLEGNGNLIHDSVHPLAIHNPDVEIQCPQLLVAKNHAMYFRFFIFHIALW